MTIFHELKLLNLCKVAALGCLWVMLAFLQGCAGAKSVPVGATPDTSASQAAGLFVPAGIFGKSGAGPAQSSASSAAASAAMAVTSAMASSPLVLEVLLYASPTTQNYFAKGGIDAKINTQQWEVFLRKYKIPFQVVTSVDKLEKAQPGILLLPSSVALSEREKQAVTSFRAKGGGVLASWLTGVRGEKGEWQGFGFMESALDAKVVGNTEADENDNFMMPHGDSPVTHSLPAGMRIWLDRPKDWYPLRLVGRHPAAQIMDWSRAFVLAKPTSTIVFDERPQPSGQLSRSVVLGYPERLWLTADPKLLEAIAHNSLMWLLRRPDAYLSAWPYPYKSAFVLAVDSAEVILDTDVAFAQSLENAGGRATYYVLSENAAKSAENLKKIKARGHEVNYLGDRFAGFRDQSSAVQGGRLDAMVKGLKSAGVEVAEDAGFHAPMESYDKNTEKLLKERAFGHYIAFMDSTDARLPFFAPVEAGATKPVKSVVVLPRTQNGPEDSMEEGDPEIGLKTFLSELELSERMGGLSVVRVPNQSLLTAAQSGEIFKHLKARRDQMWLATSGQVADWWRERARVTVRLESGVTAPQLTVTVKPGPPLQQAAAALINLPESGSTVRLVARGVYEKSPKVASVDAWRTAVVLDGLAAGEYQWYVYFDRMVATTTK